MGNANSSFSQKFTRFYPKESVKHFCAVCTSQKFIKFILFKVFFEFDKFSAACVFVYWTVFDEWFPACLNALEKEDKWLI